LIEITQESIFYEQARRMLSANLATKEHFEAFNVQDSNQLQDTEMLNRTMYHKIKNEIGIILEIVHEIIADVPEPNKILFDIRKHIQTILDGIQTKRQLEESRKGARVDLIF